MCNVIGDCRVLTTISRAVLVSFRDLLFGVWIFTSPFEGNIVTDKFTVLGHVNSVPNIAHWFYLALKSRFVAITMAANSLARPDIRSCRRASWTISRAVGD